MTKLAARRKSLKSVSHQEAMQVIGEMEVSEKLDLQHSILIKGVCAAHGAIAVFLSASGESAMVFL